VEKPAGLFLLLLYSPFFRIMRGGQQCAATHGCGRHLAGPDTYVAIAYSQLNSKQKEAANHVHGPMLVLAGAGTGKTSVLVHRVSRLISGKHARPNEICAFTFTHKAAREIRERVSKSSAGMAAAGLHASTFHGYCYELLREAGEDFQLLDQIELWTFLRQRIADLPLNHFLRAANPGRFLKDLLLFFDRCADELVTASSYAEYVARVSAGELAHPRVAKRKQNEKMGRDEVLARCEEISAIFTAVENLLAETRLLTFGALVSRATALLRSDGQLLLRERLNSRFLLVDEFQDSNHAQIELTRVLAGDEQNVFAVGDPDQAIYHFRGASSAAFNEFVAVFDKLAQKNVLNLAENQRSAQNILDCGFSTINRNPALTQQGSRVEFDRERLRSARDEEEKARGNALLFATEPVEVVPYRSYTQECSDIAQRIIELHDQGVRWSDCAVLFRSHSNAEGVVDELGSTSIPFEVQDTDLFETDVLRDLTAWLHCTTAASDDVSFFRLALRAELTVDLPALYAKLSAAPRGTKVAKTLEQVEGGAELLARLRTFAERHNPVEGDLLEIIDGAAELLGVQPDGVEVARFRNFAASWRDKRIARTGRLHEFLEFLDLYREGGGTLAFAPSERPEDEFHPRGEARAPEIRDAVKLLTIHAAKGLEFKHVFVLRVATTSFPTSYKETLFEFPRELAQTHSRIDKTDEQVHKEEERRLFYVAVTRARDTLTLYGKLRGGKNKQEIPYGFLRELTEDSAVKHAIRVRGPREGIRTAVPAELPGWIAPTAGPKSRGVELSASAIDAYATCPLKYALQKQWRLPEQPSAALQYGSAMHSVLQDFYDAALRGVSRTAEESIELFLREFEQAKIEEELQRTLYKRQGVEQLREFIALRALEPNPQVLTTEKSFRFAIEDVMINGRIDRIDRLESGGVQLLDYKTGAPKNDVDAATSVQLGIYGMAAQLEGHSVEKLVFYNLEDNSTAETDRINEDRVRGRVLEVAEGIRSAEFSPTPGFHCKNCGYHSLCPATVERVFAPAEARTAAVSV
jgi:DNA helicase II / ATP-dependent DNA helicase PcrA